MANKKELLKKQSAALIDTLKIRFAENTNRHKGIDWKEVEEKLRKNQQKIWSIYKMEETGGEPDVIGFDKETKEFIFADCSLESPKGRRSICYDKEALDSRKENKPKNCAIGMAEEMGIEILTEDQYRDLQKLGKFDSKTSSWIKTPLEIRKLGGALFSDYRFEKVFVYHNGAESYYAGRGFRGKIGI